MFNNMYSTYTQTAFLFLVLVIYAVVHNAEAYPACQAATQPYNLTMNPGGIRSPNYPRPYSPNMYCFWRIVADAGNAIRIKWAKFDLEESKGCVRDRLDIYDGMSGQRLTRLCGNELPQPVVSSSNIVKVKFHSNSRGESTGFRLIFEWVPASQSQSPSNPSHNEDVVVGAGATTASSAARHVCGVQKIRPDMATHRIVGGQEALSGSWPWQVMLQLEGVPTCGGTILTPRRVITAAHCFTASTSDPAGWSAVAGKHRKLTVDDNEQKVSVSRIVKHSGFDLTSSTRRYDNDIAILYLSAPFSFNERVQPICLPTAQTPLAPGQNCTVTGFGKTKGTGNDDVLKQADIDIIDDTQCRSLPNMASQFTENMVCAGTLLGGKDACQGDSGGPLVCRCPYTGRYRLDGIVSWGIGCGLKNQPGIYTRVKNYRTFIDQHI